MKKLIVFDWGRTLYDPETEKLFPDTIEVLERLSQKYTLAIVALATAGEKKIKERLQIIKENNLEQYFTSILFDVKDKDIMYVKTLKDLKFKPKEVIIVDDRIIRGIKWGNKNGAPTIWFQNGKFKDELPNEYTGEPTYTIHSLSDILKNI
jgi:FMN phosphatase YigB (HAD superfamily)